MKISLRHLPLLRRPRLGKLSLSLSLQLSLGFALVLIICSAASVFAWFRLEALAAKDGEIRMLAARQQTALELRSLVEQMDSLAAGYMISGKPELKSQYMDDVSELTRLTEEVGLSAVTSEQRNWRARMVMVSQEFVDHFVRSAAIVEDESLLPAEKLPRMTSAFNGSQIHKQVIFELVQSFYDDYTAAETEARHEFSALIELTRTVALWASAVAVVVAVVVAAVIVRSLTLGVRRLRQGIERVKSGDLTQDIHSPSKDELGRLSDDFDACIAAVRGMLAQSGRIAESLQQHSRGFRSFAASTKDTNASIVRAMEEIAVGATRQAEQSDLSVKAIRELEERMDGILLTAGMLLETSRDAKGSVELGTRTAAALNESSERSGEALRTMSEAMRRLEARSAEISNMTNAIHNISQQTNVLALNASIEAARAGEHGLGFAVIAEEVRQLSVQTTEESRRIGAVLKQLRAGVQESAETLASTADSFTDQRHHVAEAGEAFRTIVRFIEAFDEEINHISDRVNEAKRKQSELVGAVHVVASVAQQAAAGVEETVAAASSQDASIVRIAEESGEMNALAETLFAEIHKFKM